MYSPLALVSQLDALRREYSEKAFFSAMQEVLGEMSRFLVETNPHANHFTLENRGVIILLLRPLFSVFPVRALDFAAHQPHFFHAWFVFKQFSKL